MANGDIKSVRIAPCRVTFGTNYLGSTIGGVQLELKTTTKQIVVDQFGQPPLTREFITQRVVTVSVPLAETDVTTLNAVLAASGSYIDTNTATEKQVTIPANIGLDLAGAGALPLYLATIPASSGDKYSCTYIMARANMTGSVVTSLKKDDARMYTVEFTAYPDTAGNIMYFHEYVNGKP